MRKIKSLMELDFTPLLSTEAISTKGGGSWRYDGSLGGWTYWLDEVTVTGEDQSFDYGEWWSNVAGGAGAGAAGGLMEGAALGSFLGPAGTFGGAVGGAITFGLIGAVTGGVNNYINQTNGY